MTIKIRKQTPEDIEGINNVYYKTWLDTYPNEEAGITVEDIEDSFKDSFTKEYIEQAKEKIRSADKNNRLYLLAEDCGKIVGVSTIIREEKRNHLRTIYVLPEYQGKGVGTSLWNEGKKFLDPDKETVVEVTEYNTDTIKFYEKIGFVKTGKRVLDERFRMKNGAILPDIEMIRLADN